MRRSLVAVALLAAWFGHVAWQSAQAHPLAASQATVVRTTFSGTDADVANPERGFYWPADAHLHTLGSAEAADAYANGFRLIYVRIDLEPYRDAELPAHYLEALESGLEAARAGGVKLIVRATYNYPQGETEYRNAEDASLARVLGHIAQLKPVLDRNVDVTAFVQAGFIGAWGEWHTSSNGLTGPVKRTRIRDALLDAVPASRFIQFRYPPYMRDWTPRLPGLEEALRGDFRMGFHNDCFLASTTDVGTYEEAAQQRAVEQNYIDALGDLAVFGGETCNPADESGATPRADCVDILSEGARYNLTYLNERYYRRIFHENWSRHGCMDEVRRRMGYRFALLSASHGALATRGDVLAVSIVVRNSGWARLYNPRPVEIVLRHATSGAVHRLNASGADPRTWLPNADSAEILEVALPGDLPAGAYDVLVALPDGSDRIHGDPRFAVRFANADDDTNGQGWDARLGAFALGTMVLIR